MTNHPAVEELENPLMYELVVVGAGPAGLAAALFATIQRIKVVLVSKNIGGQAMHSTHVENYMGFEHIAGAQLVERFEQQLQDYFIQYMVDDVKIVTHERGVFSVELGGGAVLQARTVLVATGMLPNQLRVPGEMEFTGRGVSYFADHYGPTAHDKNVLVVGGGNSGLQAVLEVAPVARKVWGLTRAGWTGDPGKISEVGKFTNVEMLTACSVVRLEGGDRLERVIVKPTAGGDENSLDIDLLFIEIGFHPSTELLKGLTRLNERGEIIVDRENGTDVPGLFAAGDCTAGIGKEIAVAVGDGARAALSAKRFIRSRAWRTAVPN